MFDESTLQDLDQDQLQAVQATEGFVRVIAGAGSGKTRTLAYRFAWLTEVLGIMPGHILCATFTNKAAHEMRARIRSLIGDAETSYVATFHGFCTNVLQEDGWALALPRRFMVLDNSDIDAILRLVYEECGLTLRDKTYQAARDMFEIRKCKDERSYYRLLTDETIDAVQAAYRGAKTVDDLLFYGYLYNQKKCFGLDYNDLIILTLALFEARADIAHKWQARLEYVMIDEFQDIDGLQYQLMETLCAYHKNLFVVGDPDQMIYSWRGANMRYLLDFDKHFEPCQTLVLNNNYRSTTEILGVANDLIDHNHKRMRKFLVSAGTKTHGELPLYLHADASSGVQSAVRVTEELLRWHSEAGLAWSEMAVLYRAHYVSRQIEEALDAAEVPYELSSGVSFYERREIKDLLSYLRLLMYKDDLSFERVVNVPKRNMGKRRLEFLRDVAESHNLSLFAALEQTIDDPIFKGTGARVFIELINSLAHEALRLSISDLMSLVLNQSGYERMLRTEGAQDRLDNLAELKQAALEYELYCGEEAQLPDYLAHVATYGVADGPVSPNRVQLMTIHAAKGLEFRGVALVGMAEGVFPGRKIKTIEALEEERRLAFVAMTRAKEYLLLSDGEGISQDASKAYPSRFVLEIEPVLLAIEGEDARGLSMARDYLAMKTAQLKARGEAQFKPGDRVEHIQFGPGTIVAVADEEYAYVVKFDGQATERTISQRVPLRALES